VGLNQVTIQGKLGQDPDVRYTAGGDAVCKFSMAVAQKYTDKSGDKKEKVYWATVVAWRKLGEICGQYLSKGQECIIVGSLQMSEWEKNGVKMKSTEVVAEKMFFSGPAPKGKAAADDDEFPF
jgi:single-strand DNA-binding protein